MPHFGVKMAKLNLCFSGWLTGVEVTRVMDCQTLEDIDISGEDTKTVIANLNSGDWMLSFKDALANADENEIEIFDIEDFNSDQDAE
jgi:hypothetical protein